MNIMNIWSSSDSSLLSHQFKPLHLVLNTEKLFHSHGQAQCDHVVVVL